MPFTHVAQILTTDFELSLKTRATTGRDACEYPLGRLEECCYQAEAHNREVLQQALARYYELEYRDDFDVPQLPEGFTDKVSIRHLKNFVFCPFRLCRWNLASSR